MVVRHLTSRVLVGLTIGFLLGGCGSGAATPPMTTPTPTALPTSAATPTASPVPTASPTSTPKPTPTPEPVAGWPSVSRAGITMTGTTGTGKDPWEMDGRLRLSVGVTGLAPGEAVSLSAAGTYTVKWACGSEPEPCGDIGCAPSFQGTTEGTAEAAAQAVAGSDGAAAAQIEIVAVPPAESCPTDSSAPWWTTSEQWEKVRIADPVHGLVLTPDTIERSVTF